MAPSGLYLRQSSIAHPQPDTRPAMHAPLDSAAKTRPPFAGLWEPMRKYLPYLLIAGVVLFMLLCGEKIWLTNDDVRMSMTVGGYGIGITPSAGLVLESNVIWGWLLMHVPDLGGIRGYTVATYALLLLSCMAACVALLRLKVPAWLAAAGVIGMYVSVIGHPQFTLLAGYLAVAGYALVLASDETHLYPYMAGAALALILASLVRPDEFALVSLVASPFLLHAWLTRPNRRWRLHWAALAGVCALLMAGAYLYNAHYGSSGDWQAFAAVDDVRSDFVDYGYGNYFNTHKDKLAVSNLSFNDLRLLHSWFILDPKVFNPASLGPLVDQVSLADRIATNPLRLRPLTNVLTATDMEVLLAVFLACLLLDWRRCWPEVAAFAILLGLMTLIMVLGRPGVERIYLPAAAGMMVLALLKLGRREGLWVALLSVAVLAVALNFAVSDYQRGQRQDAHAVLTRAATCAVLPKDQLLLIWSGGAQFDWKSLYRPTTPVDDPCDPPLYSFGSYQLAPPSLAQLHAHTGGKDLIDALLAGQTFYIVTSQGRLQMLDRYLSEHYHYDLSWQQQVKTKGFQLFTIQAARTH